MRSLERIVSAYLDLAEDRAERHIPMTMEDWAKRLDLFLMADDREVLQDAGKITAEIAKAKAETEFENIVSFRTDCSCLTLINTCWNWKRMRRSNRIASLFDAISQHNKVECMENWTSVRTKIAVDLFL